jgi:hypothetical protein
MEYRCFIDLDEVIKFGKEMRNGIEVAKFGSR